MSGNLDVKRLPPLVWDDEQTSEQSMLKLHDWAVQKAASAVRWYFDNKTSKARWSRFLRFAAIVLTTAGFVLPLVAAQRPDIVDAGWGYVVLALAAGVVGFDRFFGTSSAWMRYVVAAMAIESRSARFEVESEMARLDSTKTAEDRIGLLRDFVVDVVTEVERETLAWAEEFRAGVNELRELSSKHTQSSGRPAARG